MKPKKDDFTKSQVDDFHRKFERCSTPRYDLRVYDMKTQDSDDGAVKNADAIQNRLDRDSSLHMYKNLSYISFRLSKIK